MLALLIKWEDDKNSFKKKRKAHLVTVRSCSSLKEKDENKASYYKALRSFSIGGYKSAKPLLMSEIYRAISKELEAKAIDLKGQHKDNTVPVKRGDIYELCDCLHQVLKSQKEGKAVHNGITFQLRLLLSRLRTASISAQFQAILYHWSSRYFTELSQSMEDK